MKQETMKTVRFCTIIGLTTGAIAGLLGSSYLPYFLIPLSIGLFLRHKSVEK